MVARRFTERYSLDVQINSSHNAVLWRALDNSLNRVVCIVLLPHRDARAQALLVHAKAAAINSTRSAVAILDIVERDFVQGVRTIDAAEPYLGIVTEWVDGRTLDHIIGENREPLPIKEALKILGAATGTVGAMHQLGLIHGRLRPRNIYLNEAGEVRVTGFGIDGALFVPDGKTKATDIAGLGDLLFAMTTATWPTGSVGALPAAEILDDRTLTLPSQQRVGVDPIIDELYQKTQDGTITTAEELGQEISIAEVATAKDLKSRVNRWTDHEVAWHGRDIPKPRRVRAVVLAFGSTYLFGIIGWQLMTHNYLTTPATLPSLPVPTSIPSSSPNVWVSPSPTISASSDTWPTSYAALKSATDYDPYGDGTENSEQTELAIDGDPATAWQTTNYYTNSWARKPGVGLIIDLGESTRVRTVDVSFISPAHSATVFITDESMPDISKATVFDLVSNSDQRHTFTAESPQTGRYVLIWLTKLPRNSYGALVGGITEVKVGL